MATGWNVVVLAALCLCAQVASAANADDLINGSFDASSKKARIDVARNLLDKVNRLADLVPTPRPSDLSWVEEEHAAIDRLGNSEASRARLEQFYETPEFQHVKLYNLLLNVKNAIACVLESNVQLRREISCWATASFLLGDRNTLTYGMTILQRAKRLPEDTLQKEKVGSLDLFQYYSRGIQEYLVLPYLRGEIK